MPQGKSSVKARSASRAGQRGQLAVKSPKKVGAKTKSAQKRGAKGGKNAKSGTWRAAMLAEVRRLIQEADPDISEDCKWIKPTNPLGVPVWSHAGIVCTGETYQQVVKLTFFRGASLPDPRRLFNSSLDGNTRRAIDIREGEVLDASAFKALIQAAVEENLRAGSPKTPSSSKASTQPQRPPRAKARVSAAKPVKLLTGGNPQIAKADGDAPVQAYIAAMPGWKQNVGKQLDLLIAQIVPHVRRAVKWNSPFYGIEGQGWFLSFHVFTRYVKVTFFSGTSMRSVPPGGTGKDARWIDIHEDGFDESQMASWIKQAAALPGWNP